MRALKGVGAGALAVCLLPLVLWAQQTSAPKKQDEAAVKQPAKVEQPAAPAEQPKPDTGKAAAKTGDAKTDTAKADDAKADDASKAADEAPPVTCSVKDIKGTVEWRPTKDAEWQAVAEGHKLPLGADVCTGFRAGCTLVFVDESSVVQLQPLTIVRIGEFERQGDKVRTRIYLMQGGTESIVEKSRFKSDFAIVTPEVTLAVRGTKVVRFTQHWDLGPKISLSLMGNIVATDNKTKRQRRLRPKDVVKRGLLPAFQNLKFKATVPVFDMHGGLTRSEQFSLMKRPQTFFGPPNLGAPAGGGFPGPGALRRAPVSKAVHYILVYLGGFTPPMHEWECD